jgi:hypothetical protein
MTKSADNEEKVKPLGSYFDIDKDGYVVNPASFEKIQDKWLKPIEETKDEYIARFGSALHSLYIRGSVPKGKAIDNVSDLDTFAVVNLTEEEIDTSWWKEINEKIKQKYPFVEGIEIVAIPLNEFEKSRGDKIMVKTQSLCLYGTNLADAIPPYKVGFETTQHIQNIATKVEDMLSWFQEDKTDEKVLKKCGWIMKQLLRSASELVMERSGKYTRDLYPCYEIFSQYYPQKKDEMYKVLELAIYPTKDKQVILEVVSGIGKWIANEADEYLKKHNDG